jgi:hypothetical protein
MLRTNSIPRFVSLRKHFVIWWHAVIIVILIFIVIVIAQEGRAAGGYLSILVSAAFLHCSLIDILGGCLNWIAIIVLSFSLAVFFLIESNLWITSICSICLWPRRWVCSVVLC